MAYNISR